MAYNTPVLPSLTNNSNITNTIYQHFQLLDVLKELKSFDYLKFPKLKCFKSQVTGLVKLYSHYKVIISRHSLVWYKTEENDNVHISNICQTALRNVVEKVATRSIINFK